MKIPAEKLKSDILESLKSFDTTPLKISATRLFGTLGYRSDRTLDLSPNTPKNFLQTFDAHGKFRQDKGLLLKWASADILFQVTDEEINALSGGQLRITFESDKKIEDTVIQSYLFTAVELKKDHYTRTELARITREINRLFPMPVLILFKNGETLTFSIINRRLHKKDTWKDVLEKVTLIKDIRYASPHRAHIEILYDLTSSVLFEHHHIKDFVSLHQAWQKTLDTNELNKRFYREMANWYFWALHNVTFPSKNDIPEDIRNPVNVIRLITRIIFVWFVKEKGLIPEALFNKQRVNSLLDDFSPESSSYYKAVLQNLFFATLNTKMGERKFRDERRYQGKSNDYMMHNRYRSRSHFNDPESIVELTKDIPFLNGGLFECLDRETEPVTRIDGFSDRADNELSVPNYLFFSDDRAVDLNADYGTKNKKYRVRGLIDLLQSYKFTITENTPIEEEIALDPELLGKVFENLLASYNPETETTARKLTGSFYTPREIVNYMVDEALIAYLENALARNFETDVELSPRTPPSQGKMFGKPDPVQTKLTPTRKKIPEKIRKEIQEKLRHLFEYNEEDHQFTNNEVETLIEVIDNMKILDPACGSGAFPMGILHRLVYLLGRLDPGNKQWKDKQVAKASEIQVQEVREEAIENIEYAFERNELDYPRKLYLIQNCIFGVDIQPVAVQIAKLRFFISLIVDQKIDNSESNRGLKPLPNLETKIVAANALIGLKGQMKIRGFDLSPLENELKQVRRDYFEATSRKKKRGCEERDKEIREKIAGLLETQDLFRDTSINLSSWDPYNQNQAANFFDPEWMFGETQGFDIVIGNPPYIRQEKIRDLKPVLQRQYNCYTGTADLYIYFYELGFNLLKIGGILSYISSNKYFRSAYGQKLRSFLGSRTRISHLIDFGDAPVFTSIAYPSIIVFQKQDGAGGLSGRKQIKDEKGEKSNIVKSLTWKPGLPLQEFVDVFKTECCHIEQKGFASESWHLESAESMRLLEKLRNTGKLLGDFIEQRFYRGILTGLNEAFVVDRLTRERLIEEDPSCSTIFKPFLRGKDVKRWRVHFGEQYLIKIESSANKKHPWSDLPVDKAEMIFSKTYPSIYEHLQKYRNRLISRDDQGKYYWELRACKYWDEFEKKKIVWGNLAKNPKFSFAEAGIYLNAPAVMLISDNEYLLGVLNSKVTQYLVQQSAAGRQGGFLEFKPMYISKLAIPEEPKIKTLAELVKKLLSNLRDDSSDEIIKIEAEINSCAAHLYKLTEKEYSFILSETDTPEHFRTAALNAYRDMA